MSFSLRIITKLLLNTLKQFRLCYGTQENRILISSRYGPALGCEQEELE